MPFAIVASAGVAALGNFFNQYANYHIEKKQYAKNNQNGKAVSDESTNNTEQYIPEKYQSFTNYVDVDSIATSAIAAAVCAPLAVAGGGLVTAIFGKIPTVSVFLGDLAIGADVSMFQTALEYIISIF